MPHKSVTIYLVRPINWVYNDEYHECYEEDATVDEMEDVYGEFTPPRPLKSFLTPEKAEVHRLKLERDHRKDSNPFEYGGYGDELSDYSTHTANKFCDRLREVDIAPPSLNRQGKLASGSLYDWWEKIQDDLTSEQSDIVWDLLDRVRFYRVVPHTVQLTA